MTWKHGNTQERWGVGRPGLLPFSWRWPEDKEIHMKLGPSCEVLTKEILISSDLHISCTSLTIGNSIFLPVLSEELDETWYRYSTW